MDAHLLQFVGSLIAIFLLAALAKGLGLGGKPGLTSSEQIRAAASEVVDGFVVDDFALDAKGASALVRSAEGQVMVIKRHGNRFAGRVLDDKASAVRTGHKLSIDTGESRFGSVSLEFDKPDPWVEAINRLGVRSDG